MPSISSSSPLSSSPINRNQKVESVSNSPTSMTHLTPTSAENKSSLVALEIIRATAYESYSSSGSKISQGLAKDRVVLDQASLGFSIAAKKIPKGSIRENFAKANLLYVHLKDDVYINVNSLSKRLHIDKKSIYQAAKTNQLEDLINTHLKSTKEKFILFEALMGKSTSRSEHQTQKIMKVSSKIFKESKKQGDKSYLVDNMTIIVKQHKNNSDFISSHRIYKWNPNEMRVAEGGTSTIHKVKQLVLSSNGKSREETWILKKALKGMEVEIIDENIILNTVHDKLEKEHIKPIGFQERPIDSLNVKGELAANVVPKCDGDMKDKILSQDPDSIKSILSDSYQLLYGINQFHRLGYVHQDLKPENIFIKDSKTMISDVGGSQLVELPSQEKLLSYNQDFYDMAKKLCILPTHTPQYASLGDMIAFSQNSKNIQKTLEFIKNYIQPNKETLSQVQEIELQKKNKELLGQVQEMVQLRQKWDRFSMGLILYERCIKPKEGEDDLPPGLVYYEDNPKKDNPKKDNQKTPPYVLKDNFDRNDVFEKLLNSSPNFPREIANLITDLIDPRSSKAPTIDPKSGTPTGGNLTNESFEKLEQYLGKNHKNIIDEVEKLY